MCKWEDARSIIATYDVKTVFPIPCDMDKTAEWYIKWDRLHYKDIYGCHLRLPFTVCGACYNGA